MTPSDYDLLKNAPPALREKMEAAAQKWRTSQTELAHKVAKISAPSSYEVAQYRDQLIIDAMKLEIKDARERAWKAECGELESYAKTKGLQLGRYLGRANPESAFHLFIQEPYQVFAEGTQADLRRYLDSYQV